MGFRYACLATRASAAPDLPDDIAALKDLVLPHAARERRLEQEPALVRERLILLLAKRYGRSSEQVSPDQLALFNEAEAASDAAPECEAGQRPGASPVAAHTRARRGRRAPPAFQPRVRIEHDLPNDEKVCVCGCAHTPIGEEMSEQLYTRSRSAPPLGSRMATSRPSLSIARSRARPR